MEHLPVDISVESGSHLPSHPQDHIFSLLTQALDKGVSVEVLERLVALQREIAADNARRQFYAALADCQEECGIIVKSNPVTIEAGRVAYKYAPFDKIVAATKHILRKHGFSYNIDSRWENNRAYITFHIYHVDGHHQQHTLDMAPVERTKLMTEAQRESATMTLAIRRAYCNALGIVTGDKDVDGNAGTSSSPQRQPITQEQIARIATLNDVVHLKEATLTKGYGVSLVESLNTNQADHLIQRLERYIVKGDKDTAQTSDVRSSITDTNPQTQG